MKHFSTVTVAAITCLSVPTATISAQRGTAEWLTDGGDAQRTSWQQHETAISPATVTNFKLLWTAKLDNQPRALHSLLPALLVSGVETRQGTKEVVVVAGVSDNLYALDAANGELLWKRHFENPWSPEEQQTASVLCPGGMTATPVIAPAGARGKYTVYAASWDGKLHQVNAADGEEIALPAEFMPPNLKPYALNLWNDMLYSHTAQCSSHMVYAFDLRSGEPKTYGPVAGGMWGRAGPAISSKGVMYTGTGDGPWDPENNSYGSGFIGVARDPASSALELADYYGPINADWLYANDLDIQVTPAIFPYQGKELLVASSKECRIYLMDTESIGGDDHRTPLDRTEPVCNEEASPQSAGVWGTMATWEDAGKTRWVLAPFWGPKHSAFTAPIEHGKVTDGAVVAFKVERTNGTPKLVPAWISRDMNRAERPTIANGVIFAYGSGEHTTQTPDPHDPTPRIEQSTHAVLYALDAETGKELWSSGDQIASWVHWGGLSIANGRVYLSTFDGTVYAFGLADRPARSRTRTPTEPPPQAQSQSKPRPQPQTQAQDQQSAILPNGAGKEETTRACVGCHTLDRVASARKSRRDWSTTLTKMKALGAKPTDAESKAILEYLATYFPAKKVGAINVNTASAIKLESGLSIKRSEAAAIVQYRTEHGAFNAIDDLKKVPGLDFQKVEAKKDRIAFTE